MRDPDTVAFEIKSPFVKDVFNGYKYRSLIITIWHCDPERRGDDDSCGWFIRGRHLPAADRALADYLIRNEHDNLRHWFSDCRDQEEMIGRIEGIFAALRRRERPWWRHPRWHFWHWQFQIHPWQQFRRWMLTRCALCGKPFKFGESPVSHQWHSPKPKFLRGETDCYHSSCSGMQVAGAPENGNE